MVHSSLIEEMDRITIEWLNRKEINKRFPPHKEEQMSKENSMQLPNGYTLYWEENDMGGRVYTSDVIDGGVEVWDTCLIDITTLQTAIMKERELIAIAKRRQKNELRNSNDK